MAECRRANLGDKHPCRSCAVSARAVCNTLDVQALAELRNQGGEVRLSQGEALFHQGDRADCVFSLTSGIIQLYALLPDGRRQVIAFHFPGEFIGLCGWGDHHCTAEAVSRATLCRFDAARFEQFARRKAELAQSSQHRLTGDLIAAQNRTVLLGRATARERLACFLHDVHHRSQAGAGAGAPGNVIHLPMSRIDIADYLGLTKETVSREFTALRQARTIRSRPGRQLEILDMARICSLAFGTGTFSESALAAL
ncbi:cyclic nucleotide-binding domain-containing protein [Sphingobium sp. HBC34]|uniref:Cyclic nucleotide-binding domain-containing protein n=1 Tax=Sphingobium cyanobacteriorum TaxID=3063954 RepID=A0ABT8ZTR5_9SPHN|nr:cyclic nucleotide-binding domain-containing protein [Sphingobium sp. HBC34]MDE1918421.1 cyclic nucleotide-binding domain-containing protein [Sphingomonadales bacterium]MDE2171261.1 cyclic nucleotide-binding domain-containing protein [Sphingomonadales bacterium]MDO7837130.1 cyclic nucleotide-binding domain-containing protein [Sphingobium sp. HBC34]